MIYDAINHWELYFKNPIFREIFNNLKTLDAQTPDGIYFACEQYQIRVMTYQTKEIPTIIESHQKEVDIHVVLAGEERIKLFGRKDVIVTTPYNAEKDCQLYKAVNPPVIDLHLTPKNMAVLFPQDIHQPQFIAETKSQTIKKVVVKVKEFVFGEH
ncbi:Protein yiaL [Capnocytophaga canimorsus]|uniref:Protein yiaL n=1 Tax=Capnocytophaga canimorsus TaxID=28188 RepID=A0A0B7HA89_9FLAO|nr:YhcH/YjgK/YiaL family protein [Capnocytophaga canimorsus]ATA77425.1 YhcH/YjgK/YiaL family protein [Capnocytophaga canimorsus]PJI82391.1 YhcH/YjgK/YiaL family protein [Capnocytophaga canimorsus]CEN36205.1 Protein yiaL [Capnocytophaga canimorsus]STA72682.1 uncharacterized protein, YhcH/YjgK/YiaL family [Capnocytophaga canimorsus]GIM59600.1 hypothetical protein CAPN007_18090 [Capnocytophaga canimorsus]